MKKLSLLIMLSALIAGCAGGSQSNIPPPKAQPADIPPPTDLLTAPATPAASQAQ